MKNGVMGEYTHYRRGLNKGKFVLKNTSPIIDTFDICALCNIRKTLPTYRRDRWRLVHPEVVTLGGPNSHLQSL